MTRVSVAILATCRNTSTVATTDVVLTPEDQPGHDDGIVDGTDVSDDSDPHYSYT